MIAWVLWTVHSLLVLLEFALNVVLDLLGSRGSGKNHLSTLPAIFAVHSFFVHQKRNQLFDRSCFTSASVTHDEYGELVSNYDFHEELLLNCVFSGNHDVLELNFVLEFFVKVCSSR